MKSVLVTDSHYRSGNEERELRPDELLQMYGRAGRRGLDQRGYLLTHPTCPNRSQAAPLRLQRVQGIDWPACLTLMAAHPDAPAQAAQTFASRLFTPLPPDLGLSQLAQHRHRTRTPTFTLRQTVVEMLNSANTWERLPPPTPQPLGQALYHSNGRWMPALRHRETLASVAIGTLCHLGKGPDKRYGRLLPLATFPSQPEDTRLTLTKTLRQLLRPHFQNAAPPRHCTLETLQDTLLPLLPSLTAGATPGALVVHGQTVHVPLDYARVPMHARLDSLGRALLNPPTRQHHPDPSAALLQLTQIAGHSPAASPAALWYQLGLINHEARPTPRGQLFSYFHHAEGLPIATALEDLTYPIEALLGDLANLRAGHRFARWEGQGSRLGALCRLATGGLTVSGYLDHGLPPTYGEGAATVLNDTRQSRYTDENLHPGDIERARLEWLSLLRLIAHAPPLDAPRWQALQQAAAALTDTAPRTPPMLPPLTAAQKLRHSTPLRFV